MHITLETDYAVRIVDYIARSHGRVGSQAIADGTTVTLRFALKILRKLVASGILVSFKGTSGGYELNRPVDEITLYDVIETIEGPYQFSRCLAKDHVCIRNDRDQCPYHELFGQLTADIRVKLQSINFAETIPLHDTDLK